MDAFVVVVRDVFAKQPTQVVLIQHDHVIEQLPANRCLYPKFIRALRQPCAMYSDREDRRRAVGA